jgi:hypothetical protein
MKMPSSSAQDRQVAVWFQKIESGELKLPRFQRHQAWDNSRVCSLLNTATSNLPLGVTLLLNVDKEQFVSRYLATAPETGGRVTEHLLDGQQRLTSLWRALHNNYEGGKYFLYFDTYDESMKPEEKIHESEAWYQNRWKNNKGNMMPLWADKPVDCIKRGLIPMELFRPGDIAQEVETWVDTALSQSKPTSENEDFENRLMAWMESKNKINSIIRDVRETMAHFNLPFLALPTQTSKGTALQVFINMNTNSKPLSQYDIIRAEIEGVKGVSLDEYQDKLSTKYPNVQHYFELPFLILATSALMQDKLPNQRGMWDMSKDQMVDNWERMSEGLSQMAIFMEGQGIYDKNRLPTNAVLAVIAALFTYIPETLDLRGKYELLIKKYMWSSFFTGRYENSAASHAFNDFIALKNIITKAKKEDGSEFQEQDVAVLNRQLFPLATEDELLRVGWPKRESIRGRGIMAVFSKLGAHDFADGKPLSRQQLIEGKRHYHHVFPDALLKEAKVESYLALNCSLITDKTNLNISNKDPLEYLKERYNWSSEDIVDSRLKSHLIPIEELKSGGYANMPAEEKAKKVSDDFQIFIKKRAKYVVTAVNSLVQGKDIVASEIIKEVEMIEAEEQLEAET